MSKRKGIGDIHTHHMNKDAVPNNLSKQQAGGFSEGFINSAVGKFLGGLIYGKGFKKFTDILNSETIGLIADKHIHEMDEGGIDYSVILSMDFSEIDPRYKGYQIQYPDMVKMIAANAAKYPFRFFPFFFYEPRNPEVKALLKEAHEEYGYVGIKFYPAFGFDPRPGMDYFLESSTLTSIKENLEFMYTYAEDHNLPILTHCSAGGSFQVTTRKEEKWREIWQFTEPSNFLNIGDYNNLRICFAHMGGSIHGKATRSLATQWRNQISNLIHCSQQGNFTSGLTFYTDHANVLCHSRKNEEKISHHMNMVNNLLTLPSTRDHTIFGTDWPLGRRIYNLKEYIDLYKKWLDAELLDRYLCDNIAHFMFGEDKRLPDNYIHFLKTTHDGKVPGLEDWVEEREGSYYLV